MYSTLKIEFGHWLLKNVTVNWDCKLLTSLPLPFTTYKFHSPWSLWLNFLLSCKSYVFIGVRGSVFSVRGSETLNFELWTIGSGFDVRSSRFGNVEPWTLNDWFGVRGSRFEVRKRWTLNFEPLVRGSVGSRRTQLLTDRFLCYKRYVRYVSSVVQIQTCSRRPNWGESRKLYGSNSTLVFEEFVIPFYPFIFYVF